VDGNGVIILDTLKPFVAAQLSVFATSFRRNITTTLSNSIQLAVDKTDDHFKTVKFSITNIANTCNSLLLQSQTNHNHISDLVKSVRLLHTDSPDKKLVSSCECEFNNLTIKEDMEELFASLITDVSAKLEASRKDLLAIVDVKDKKLVHEVQRLSAKIESLSAEITAITHDSLESVYREIPSTQEKQRAMEDSNREANVKEPSQNDMMLFGISHEIKQLAEAVRSRNDTCVTKISLEKMIADLSEEHRRDFSSLSTKLDQLLSQFRDDGAEVRATISEMNDRMDSSPLRPSRPGTQHTFNFQQRNNQNRHQGRINDIIRSPVSTSQQGLGVSEMQRQLWAAVNKLDWPKFSGQGEYDHTEFIDWIDDCREETSIPDEYIQVKLLSILTCVAGQWYKTLRKDHKEEKWDFWREEIRKQYGTSNWMRKKQESFEKDRFVPGETPVSSWVTRQYRRLRAFEPQLSQQSMNFRLLGLMDREVEYATKTAMHLTTADMSTLINVLEDIVDKTRLGRRKFATKPNDKPPVKNVEGRDKLPVTGDIKCYSCQKPGHTSRNCPSKVHNVGTQEECQDEPSSESDMDNDHDLVIGSSAQMAVLTPTGRNNLVLMTCSNKECSVLLDSGAVKSVVGANYLSRFCADWRKFILKTKPGWFHSCSGSLKPLGIVKVRLVFHSHKLTIQFVVMENMPVSYFIIGNDYLSFYKISLLNDEGRFFSIHGDKFEFDYTINSVVSGVVRTQNFDDEVLRDAKIGPNLGDLKRQQLMYTLRSHSKAFATLDEPFGAVRGP
jgi:hypothetical protein